MQTQSTPLVSTSIGTRREFVSFHFGTPGAGEKIYVQASLHADEIPAMLTAWRLKQRLIELENAGRIRGEVILVPVANPIGLSQHVLGQFLGRFELNSGHNFNRSFSLPAAAALIERIGGQWTQDADSNTRLLRRAVCEMLAEVKPKNEFESLRREMLIMAADADVILDLHCSLEATMHLYTSPASWPAVEPTRPPTAPAMPRAVPATPPVICPRSEMPAWMIVSRRPPPPAPAVDCSIPCASCSKSP